MVKKVLSKTTKRKEMEMQGYDKGTVVLIGSLVAVWLNGFRHEYSGDPHIKSKMSEIDQCLMECLKSCGAHTDTNISQPTRQRVNVEIKQVEEFRLQKLERCETKDQVWASWLVCLDHFVRDVWSYGPQMYLDCWDELVDRMEHLAKTLLSRCQNADELEQMGCDLYWHTVNNLDWECKLKYGEDLQ